VWRYDQRYAIHADVTDASRRYVSASGTVLVTQGEFRLEVALEDRSVEPGAPASVTVRVLDYEDKPLAGVAGEVSFGRAQWEDGEERVEGATTQNWTTGETGEAELAVTPDRDGDYRLVATAEDPQGNVVRRSESLWVMGGDYASFDYPYQELDVGADRDLYRGRCGRGGGADAPCPDRPADDESVDR
jgi:hypothetical protein